MPARFLSRAFAFLSLSLVTALFVLEMENTSPGDLSASHAPVDELHGSRGCAECHGDFGAGLRAGCESCHGEIETQLAEVRGFHGVLAALGSPTPPEACGACHTEHLGPDSQLVTQASFRLAGFESLESYLHEGLDFGLDGAHDALDCAECHPLAHAEFLGEDERRFMGQTQDCASCHDHPHEGGMAKACADCHGQTHAFAELDGFEHPAGFPLEGGHAGVACAECHEPGGRYSVEALDRAQGTLPKRDCRACHESPHAAPRFLGVLAQAEFDAAFDDCLRCHSANDAGFQVWGHERFVALGPGWHAATGFPLEDPHHEQDCRACHGEAQQPFAERFPGRAAQDCAVCHGDPHRGQFFERAVALGAANLAGADGRVATPIASAAELAAELERVSCLQCHRTQEFLPTTFGIEAHAHTDFPLFESHLAVACDDCHPREADGFQDFTSAPVDCAACHDSDHAAGLTLLARGVAAFESAAPVGELADWQGCDACHGQTRFDRVESFDHGPWTGFELDGAHGDADCLACHRPGDGHDPERGRLGAAHLTFGEPIERCATCHADAHAGRLETTRDGIAADDCAACHDTAQFAPVAELDHGGWFHFELTGAHGELECAACHDRPPGSAYGELAALGNYLATRELGFATEARPEQCGRCHADAHAGQFDGRFGSATVDGRESCGRCHTTASFAGLIAEDSSASGFDHAKWTGHRLNGAHATLACAECHGRLDDHPDFVAGLHPRLDTALGSDCFQCHEDPHGGQFAVGAINDCARCHTEDASFVEGLAFDHGTHTEWPLDEQHDDLECAACHQPSKTKDGREIVRYTGLGTACVDCHGAGF
ncbi:MAG: cytochrome c3 family protein [Planctomycetota bacterium]|jgi:hypothetical protein